MVEMGIEVQMILWVIVDIIPLDLRDMVVPKATQVVVNGGTPDDPYGGGSDSSSPKYGRYQRHK